MQGQDPHEVAVLHPPDEQVHEADGGELDEGDEHEDEADDDEQVEGRDVADLRLGDADEPDGDDGEDGGGAEACPGRGLATLLGLDLENVVPP